MTNDLTSGKPLRAIIRMALPIMAGNLFQQFYGTTDTIIVGRLLGKYALAAVGSTSSLYNMILWFANGTAGGFAIILAQKFGARRYRELRQRLALSIMLSAAISLLVTVLSLLSIGRILHVMHTPAEIYPDAERYIVTVLAGLTATVAYNMAASVLRALGDSRTPLFFLIFSSLLNIGLDILFIGPLGWGTAGAARATVLAQAVSVMLCVLYMARRYPVLHMERSDWVFVPSDAAQMLRLGLPLGFMGVMTASGIIILQVAINSFGAVSVAAYAAAVKVENLFAFPLGAYGMAMSSYCGQNYGAKNYDNIRKGIRDCILLMCGTALAFMVILETFGTQIAGLFLSAADAEVTALTAEYLHVIAIFLPAFGLIMILRNSIQGMGNPWVSTLNGILESVCRIAWTMWLIRYGTFHELCYVSPTAWIMAALMMLGVYEFRIRRSLR